MLLNRLTRPTTRVVRRFQMRCQTTKVIFPGDIYVYAAFCAGGCVGMTYVLATAGSAILA